MSKRVAFDLAIVERVRWPELAAMAKSGARCACHQNHAELWHAELWQHYAEHVLSAAGVREYLLGAVPVSVRRGADEREAEVSVRLEASAPLEELAVPVRAWRANRACHIHGASDAPEAVREREAWEALPVTATGAALWLRAAVMAERAYAALWWSLECDVTLKPRGATPLRERR